MQLADFSILRVGKKSIIELHGEWNIWGLSDVENRVLKVALDRVSAVDVSKISSLDSAGAMIIWRLKKRHGLKVFGVGDTQKNLFKLILRHSKQTDKIFDVAPKISFLEDLGRKIVDKFTDFLAYMEFLGIIIFRFAGVLKGKNFRFSSMASQIEQSCVRAMPIVAVSAFLIGIVVTYQGAIQLEKFGASIFVVDLLGMSVTRELAPLLTAIVIAGRTAASYTSEIGVMKITEEIDAMRVMGFDPYYFLAIPRILALTLALWLVIFFADMVALAGGMLISKLQLGISYSEFLERLQATLAIKHLLIGLFKAPFFAFLIASIGVFRGFQVDKSSESIGIMTTRSVVNSIFAVIACDALFSIIFSGLGI